MGFLNRYRSPIDLPDTLKVFPLAGALLLPRADLPLNIYEPRYLEMIDDALAGDRLIGMIQPETGDASGAPALCRVGCAGRLTAYAETPDGRVLVTLTGISRFAVTGERRAKTPYRQVDADFAPFASDLIEDAGEGDVNRRELLQVFRDYLSANDLSADWDQVRSASNEALVNTLSSLAPYGPDDKQALLEAADLGTRAEVLIALTQLALARGHSGAAKATLQ
ncbi:LON peptidase substrate-binding domain-containing protein [soil metagenome]